MKLILSLAALAGTGALAQQTSAAAGGSSKCEADYIVSRCLESEEPKAAECGSTDYDCQCAAWQAIATCYNNCPKDERASSAQNQVVVFCRNASIYGKAAKASSTSSASETESTEEAEAVTTAAQEKEEETAEATATEDSTATATSTESPDNTGGAAELARNTGGVLLAVAGVVIAIL